MSIDFRDKYVVLPLIVAVALIFFVVLYNTQQDNAVVVEEDAVNELNLKVGEVSEAEQNRNIEDKFSAYNSTVKEQKEKFTAINAIERENEDRFSKDDVYTEEEKKRLRAEERRKEREKMLANKGDGYLPLYEDDYNPNTQGENTKQQDKEIEDLLVQLSNIGDTSKKEANQSDTKNENEENSPFQQMREQYLFLDSLNKANDPELQGQIRAEERDRKILEAIEKNKLSSLKVGKFTFNPQFNTVTRKKESEFIKAVIDETVTGYAGSRIRIRLLEDIYIGNQQMKKNNYLYAIITGFNEQRVKLNIVSVMYANEILPIKLSVYDVDGLEGLYVPSSQFREFTKELGGAAVQGMQTNQMGDSENQSQFFTSMISRVFQSTSQAISKILRQNKAKFKYNSFVYLVDDKALEETRKRIYDKNKGE